jgi:SCP-2 sterol transfer family
MVADGVDPVQLSARELAQLVKRTQTEQLRRLMHGDRRRAMLDVLFLRMPDAFRADRAGSLDAVVHWRIADRPDGGEDTYEVVIAGGKCEVSAQPERQPRLTLSLGAVEFLRMVTGNASPMALFLRGRMKATGDLGLTTRFPGLFDIPRA